MSAARVVITGVGASTCRGVGVERLTACLHTGRAADGGVAPGGERRFADVDVDIADWVHATRTDDALTLQLLAAVRRDLAATLDRVGTDGLGIILGNTSGNEASLRAFFIAGVERGPAGVNPALLPGTLINYQAAQLSNALGVMGQSTTISSGRCAGLDAIGQGAIRLQLGRDRAMLAGGLQTLDCAEAGRLRETGVEGLGEGVGLVLLERATAVNAGSAMAEVRGYACGVGADAVVETALERAGLSREDVADAPDPSPLVGDCLVAAGPLATVAAACTLARAGGGPDALVVAVGSDRSFSALVLSRIDGTRV